ncbi:Redoxin [Abditibacterium utsteinense]|uniref:Redoxin n=1 Tax=Abditibacterium utsteinense TaxID=1960156 RepID=A0A2S8SRJ8_9BACT|nr:TlpA disulfide reductase family protein [Abditibacterium utsteinense]PQV63420.1 Redoxin [Abditibacterium utsteinense]
MEKWKIAVIAALLLGLLGFGIVQQNTDKQLVNPAATPLGTPASSVYIGKTLPAWNFKTWNSAPVPLASLRGKAALVEVFRTECPHCQDAAPFMVALHKRYGPRGFKIVSIQSPGDFKDAQNPENNWKYVQSWLKRYAITSPVAFDAGSKYFQGAIKNQVLKGDETKVLYPTILLLEPSGKVGFAQTGHDTTKAIALAVELEKRFPTSTSAAKNGAGLAQWLTAQLPELQADKTLSKALGDDIAQRLKKKSPQKSQT